MSQLAGGLSLPIWTILVRQKMDHAPTHPMTFGVSTYPQNLQDLQVSLYYQAKQYTIIFGKIIQKLPYIKMHQVWFPPPKVGPKLDDP